MLAQLRNWLGMTSAFSSPQATLSSFDDEGYSVQRTPEEVKKRRKAAKARKSQKAARKRNRR